MSSCIIKYLFIIPFNFICCYLSGQHILTNFSGDSDFGKTRITLIGGANIGTLKTKGSLIIRADNDITLKHFIATKIDTLIIECAAGKKVCIVGDVEIKADYIKIVNDFEPSISNPKFKP